MTQGYKSRKVLKADEKGIPTKTIPAKRTKWTFVGHTVQVYQFISSDFEMYIKDN